MRSGPRLAVLVALSVLAIFAGAKFVPWLTAKNDVELSTPTSPALITGLTLVAVDPGHVLCIDSVDLAPAYHTAHLLVKDPARLALTITGPGYSSTRHVVTRGDAFPLVLPLQMPGRRMLGRACVRNEGSQQFMLVGNDEQRTQSRSSTTLDGRPIQGDVPLSFWRGKRESRVAAILAGIPHMAVFKPVGAWVFWLLLPLVVLAVPALVITALALGMRSS